MLGVCADYTRLLWRLRPPSYDRGVAGAPVAPRSSTADWEATRAPIESRRTGRRRQPAIEANEAATGASQSFRCRILLAATVDTHCIL